ncbi:MAG: hypothetical protein ACOX6G_05890 [Christensenellales bacterium]|jgi:hypothetical protein
MDSIFDRIGDIWNSFIVFLRVLHVAVARMLRALVLIIIFYLLQVSVMPHLRIFGAMGNLFMSIIAILTVSYGKKYAFVAGALIGLMLEATMRSIPSFYVIIYPVLAVLYAQLFADMSEFRREMRRVSVDDKERTIRLETGIATVRSDRARAQGERTEVNPIINALKRFISHLSPRTPTEDRDPLQRILMNAFLLQATLELILMGYAALNGVKLGSYHLGNLVKSSIYTVAVTFILMFPARRFLGLAKKKRVKKIGDSYLESATPITPEQWQLMTVIQNDAPLSSYSGLKRRLEDQPEVEDKYDSLPFLQNDQDNFDELVPDENLHTESDQTPDAITKESENGQEQ